MWSGGYCLRAAQKKWYTSLFWLFGRLVIASTPPITAEISRPKIETAHVKMVKQYVTFAMIQKRAYEIWEQSGRPEGRSEEFSSRKVVKDMKKPLTFPHNHEDSGYYGQNFDELTWLDYEVGVPQRVRIFHEPVERTMGFIRDRKGEIQSLEILNIEDPRLDKYRNIFIPAPNGNLFTKVYTCFVLDRNDFKLKLLSGPKELFMEMVHFYRSTKIAAGAKDAPDFLLEFETLHDPEVDYQTEVWPMRFMQTAVGAVGSAPWTELEKTYIKANYFDLTGTFGKDGRSMDNVLSLIEKHCFGDVIAAICPECWGRKVITLLHSVVPCKTCS